jgi:hypothetical protein
MEDEKMEGRAGIQHLYLTFNLPINVPEIRPSTRLEWENWGQWRLQGYKRQP